MEKLEKNYGITSYLSDHKGFFGIIKQRYSDFQVNEISSSGEIVHLTSEEIVPVPSSEALESGEIEKPVEISDAEIEYLKVLSGQKQKSEVSSKAFVELSSDGNHLKTDPLKEKLDNPDSLTVTVTNCTKETRRAIHQFVKAHFPNLCSSTKDNGNEKIIHIIKKGNAVKRDKRDTWAKGQNHVHFVMYKENIDTVEAINVLAGKLRKVKPGMFAYAGTKDRRGKTSQIVSIYQVEPREIAAAAQRIPRIRVGNYSFSKKPQTLGQAKGNHFRIAIRNINASDEVIEEAVKSLEERGFINYYGMQRFSSTEISTHSIGKALLQGNWEEAVKLILHERENDTPEVAAAKKIWREEKNPTKALSNLPSFKKSSIEGILLSGLVERGKNNYLNAIEKIPRNVKLMYTHSYQSFIWNNVVSKRIQKYGLKVLVGDIVRKEKQKSNELQMEETPLDTVNCEVISKFDEEKDQTTEENGEETKNGEEANCEVLDKTSVSKNVRFVTEEEVESCEISEVLMPLPGFNIEYPSNELRGWYEEYLKEDGLSFELMKTKVKSFSLGGAYRKVTVRPQNMKWETCHYNDQNLTLIQSDVEAINQEDISANKLPSGTFKALILEFSLPTSTYATMALRELMKIDTSPKHQTSLTKESNEKRELEDSEGSGPEKKLKAL